MFGPPPEDWNSSCWPVSVSEKPPMANSKFAESSVLLMAAIAMGSSVIVMLDNGPAARRLDQGRPRGEAAQLGSALTTLVVGAAIRLESPSKSRCALLKTKPVTARRLSSSRIATASAAFGGLVKP